MSVIIEAHVRSITLITYAGAGVSGIIIFESGVIGPRWGLPELPRVDDDGFAAPCPTNIHVCRGCLPPTTTSLQIHVAPSIFTAIADS